ncbi:VOC family protein [Kitasatospora kifunensis]|uniref:4-hydroxymandelate synthase n=1 Tax=Kitasatospora kifunensis TaxID=58351 RepID=A0A7W7VSF0_KITKI|nr:VOC family protein [Kitasatospora kifunensis]MBB4921106.1 4-hydroxymandelate synthase [Kitasatospora kifunensis]
MAVQEIAYVELYTRNSPAAVDYLTSSLGFTRVADSVLADRSSVLLRQGEAQLILTSGRGIWKFLDEHGDGIADIALTCDEVGATGRAAQAAGAQVCSPRSGDPVVSGFGGVCHTLLPSADSAAPKLPSGRRWTATPGAPTRPVGRVRSLDQVALCLEGGSLAAHADFYQKAFGFTRRSTEHIDLGEQAMDSVVLSNACERAVFTLLAPDRAKDSGQLDAFLARNGGPGVQRLAFLVEDLLAAAHDFRDRGAEFLSTPDTYFQLVAERITGMRDELLEPHGEMLQLFSRSPFERDTLFFELVQRHGARQFGDSNLRSLYEAVERDRLTA